MRAYLRGYTGHPESAHLQHAPQTPSFDPCKVKSKELLTVSKHHSANPAGEHASGPTEAPGEQTGRP